MRCAGPVLRALGLAGAVCCLAVTVGGCAVGPGYVRPQVETPDQWIAAPRAEELPAAGAEPLAQWWRGFDDPELSALVERAVSGSYDVREALARVAEARAQRAATAGALWPQLDTSGSYSNSQISKHGFLESFASGSPGAGGSLPGGIIPGQSIDLYQAGFDAHWELDLFGHVRRAVEAADADLEAAEAAALELRVTLAAEVAREYVGLRETEARRAIAESNAAAQADTLSLLTQRYEAGVASDLDVARAEAQLADTRSRLPMLAAARTASLRRLEVLVAAGPGGLSEELAADAAIPSAPEEVEPGLPSTLLLRRPDVARAERMLAAATARIGVARAELYPRFSLTGSFGFQAQDASDLDAAASRFWLFGPSLRWPVFDAGRLRALGVAADARGEQALIGFERSVAVAFADVETSLAALEGERSRLASLRKGAEAEERAAALARELYVNGLADFLDVLDAERARFRAEDAVAASSAAATRDAIALYKALGGGWAQGGGSGGGSAAQ